MMRMRPWALVALIYFSSSFGVSYASYAGYEALSSELAELANLRYSESGVRPYEESRDRYFILDMFTKEELGLSISQAQDILRERIVNVVHEFDIEKTYPRRRIERVETLRQYPMTISMYVHQGKAVGFIMSHYESTRKQSFLNWVLLDFFKPGRIGAIEVLAVAKPMRRKGIAKKLLEFTFQSMKRKGAEWVYISTEKKNIAARRLYRSVGFTKYNEDQDRIYFMRPLS